MVAIYSKLISYISKEKRLG